VSGFLGATPAGKTFSGEELAHDVLRLFGYTQEDLDGA
jgi:hypothetical protein